MPTILIIPTLPEKMSAMSQQQLFVLLEDKIDLLITYARLEIRDPADLKMIMKQIGRIQMEIRQRT